MKPINISRIHFPITTLGPGRRVGIWLQGCSIRCPGCISADTWAPNHGATTTNAVVAAIGSWLLEADGVTISGGEPFDQAVALTDLLTEIRSRFSGDILVYSGYPLETIRGSVEAAEGLIDALMTDPFDLAAPQTLTLRGSDNQRLHLLTPLGEERFAGFERPATPADRKFNVMLDDSGVVWLAGIPERDDFQRLRGLLEARGDQVSTSEDRRGNQARRGKTQP